MNIIKQGSLTNRGTERFTCPHCGCVFEADEDEYWVSDGYTYPWIGDQITVTSCTYTINTTRKKYCNCPVCHAKCEKSEPITNPVDWNKITFDKTGDFSYTYDIKVSDNINIGTTTDANGCSSSSISGTDGGVTVT